MRIVKAMKFNWSTLGWEPVEVRQHILEAARRGGKGQSKIRQLVSLDEYQVIQRVEEDLKVAADPGLATMIFSLPKPPGCGDFAEECHHVS